MRTGRHSWRAELGTATVHLGLETGRGRTWSARSHDSIRVGDPVSSGFSSAGRGGVVRR